VPRNPFEVLGLTPELVSELSEKDLFGVLKSMYRALQKTYHPDIVHHKSKGNGKDKQNGDEKAVELNLAFEALNLDKDPASFRKIRQAYLLRKPSTAYRSSLILRDKLEAMMEKENRLAESFFDYLANGANWPNGEQSTQTLSANLPAKNIRLGLLDVAINNNIPQASWLLGSNYKQMEINSEGLLSVKAVGRSRFSRSDFIHLLGCVPVEAVDLPPILERTNAKSFKQPALSSTLGAKPKVSVMNLISLENFKRHILTLLTPTLIERAYLFSLNRAEFQTSRHISLEGIIVKFDRL
jgi:curved DNA-binding protein CbpA